MIKQIILALLMVGVSGAAWGATYYMRADGTAANKSVATGPSTDPTKCMNITVHNAAIFFDGDVIYLSDKGGIYYIDTLSTYFTPPSSGTSQYITYMNAPNESPILDGTIDTKGTTGNWTYTSPYWVTTVAHGGSINGIIQNVWFEKGTTKGPGLYKRVVSLSTDADWSQSGSKTYFYVYTPSSSNNPASYFSAIRRSLNPYIVNIQEKMYIYFKGLTFQRHWGQGPSSRTTYLNNAATCSAVFISGSDHIKIENCNFSDVETAIHTTNSTNVTLSNNTIKGLYIDAGSVTHAGGIGLLINSASTTVNNNSIDPRFTLYNGTSIVRNGMGIRCTVTDNLNSNISNLYVGYNSVRSVYGYGINLTGWFNPTGKLSINAIVEHNNLIDGNPTGGIDTDGLSCGDSISDPTTNYYSGIIFRNNTVNSYGNSGGQSTNSWRDVVWEYNLIINCGSSTAGWGGISGGINTSIVNNTIINSKGYGVYINSASPHSAIVHNNLIYNVESCGAISGIGIGGNWGSTTATSNNLIFGNNGSSLETGFSNLNGIYTNPIFISTTDFHLQSTSPCINSGVFIPGLHDRPDMTDMDSLPVDSMEIHIGAYGPSNPNQLAPVSPPRASYSD
ncbi:MAG: right-handed parallel beta-helix repeat-containing protein [Proteobacteria bacterium]|nr:right-handed parallel beta-helix repeat-containing protein [Pseudomonadota bacterium]MBU4388762.1 right-handed parallel beta-helix repeat-containing protein [Pseudomonadota bacterium]